MPPGGSRLDTVRRPHTKEGAGIKIPFAVKWGMGGIPTDGEHIPILVGGELLSAMCSKPQVPVSSHTEFGGVLEASDLCLYFSLCCCFWTQGSRQELEQAACVTSLLDCEQSQQRSRQTSLLCADLPVSPDAPPACGHSGGGELRTADQFAFCCSPSMGCLAVAFHFRLQPGFPVPHYGPTLGPSTVWSALGRWRETV